MKAISLNLFDKFQLPDDKRTLICVNPNPKRPKIVRAKEEKRSSPEAEPYYPKKVIEIHVNQDVEKLS